MNEGRSVRTRDVHVSVMTCQSPVIFILKHIKVNFTLYIFQGEQKRRLKTSV